MAAEGFHHKIYGQTMIGVGQRSRIYTEYDQALGHYQALVVGKKLNKMHLAKLLQVEQKIMASFYVMERGAGGVLNASA